MKRSISIAAVVLLMSTSLAHAQTTTDETSESIIETLRQQVSTLLQQITELREEITQLRGQQEETQQELQETREEFRSYLREGLSSDEVEQLQELLADDPSLYPEGIVSGYYGPLTAAAVRRFQARHDIEPVGVVGPQTREKLNELFVGGAGNSGNVPPGLAKKVSDFFSRGDNDNDNDNDENDENDDSNDDGDDNAASANRGASVKVCHKPGTPAEQTLSIAQSAVMAHIRHGDTGGECDDGSDDDGSDQNGDDNGDDSNNDDDNDTTVPVISNLTASSTATTSSDVIWDTDEAANGTVWYGTSTPVVAGAAFDSVSHTNFVTDHSLTLSGLTASTTYHFLVVSSDAAGNTATSSEAMLTTL